LKTAVAGDSIPTPKPKITATDPPILPRNHATVPAVTGTGFKVALAAGQTKGDKIAITVVNGDGSLDTFVVQVA
jgi:hypothetical protein